MKDLINKSLKAFAKNEEARNLLKETIRQCQDTRQRIHNEMENSRFYLNEARKFAAEAGSGLAS